MASQPIVLYGPRGSVVYSGSSNLLYEGSKVSREHKARSRVDRDWNQNLSELGFRELMSGGRLIYANCPPLKNAINLIAQFAIGSSYKPIYYGRNRAWGESAVSLLVEWHKICDVRGGIFDWATNLQLWIKAILRDGDVAVLLVETADGYPMIQTIPAHRIGGRMWNRGIVTSGKWAGLQICNGVILNQYGAAVALRIVDPLGATFNDVSLVTSIDTDGEIETTQDAFLLFDPDWCDQSRGVSRIADGLNDWGDLKQVKEFLKMALRKEASFAVVEYNETGSADAAEDFARTGPNDQTPVAALYQEKTEGGLTQIYKANSGSKVEFPNGSTRPSTEQREFWDKITRDAFQALGWPAEFYDTAQKGGAALRLIMELAAPTIERAQYVSQLAAAKLDAWRLAKAIKNKELPPDVDWWKIRHQRPAEMTVDKGYSAQIDREDYKIGFESLRGIAARRGLELEELFDEREGETAEFLARAARRAKAHNAANPDMPITIDVALSMLRQTSANPPQNQTQQAEETTAGATNLDK